MAAYILSGRGKTSFSFGGGVNDIASNDDLSYRVDLGGGDDLIVLNAGNDTIIGGTGSDSIKSGAGDDVIYMGSVTVDRLGNITNPSVPVAVRTVSYDDANGGLGSDTIYGQSNSGKGVAQNYIYGDESSNAYTTFSADKLYGGNNTGTGVVYNYIYGDCLGAPTNQDDIKVVFADDEIQGGAGANNLVCGDIFWLNAIYFNGNEFANNKVVFGDDLIALQRWDAGSTVYGDVGQYFVNENGQLLCGDDTISFSTVSGKTSIWGDGQVTSSPRPPFVLHTENFITGKDNFVFKFADAIAEVSSAPTRTLAEIRIEDFEVTNGNDVLTIIGASEQCVSIARIGTSSDVMVAVYDTSNTYQLATINIVNGWTTGFSYSQIDFIA